MNLIFIDTEGGEGLPREVALLRVYKSQIVAHLRCFCLSPDDRILTKPHQLHPHYNSHLYKSQNAVEDFVQLATAIKLFCTCSSNPFDENKNNLLQLVDELDQQQQKIDLKFYELDFDYSIPVFIAEGADAEQIFLNLMFEKSHNLFFLQEVREIQQYCESLIDYRNYCIQKHEQNEKYKCKWHNSQPVEHKKYNGDLVPIHCALYDVYSEALAYVQEQDVEQSFLSQTK